MHRKQSKIGSVRIGKIKTYWTHWTYWYLPSGEKVERLVESALMIGDVGDTKVQLWTGKEIRRSLPLYYLSF